MSFRIVEFQFTSSSFLRYIYKNLSLYEEKKITYDSFLMYSLNVSILCKFK